MSMPVPDISGSKRPRDELTDRLIKEALEDEQRRKREKKGLPPIGTGPVATKKPQKGMTLAEIEDEEGGPVKESLVGMAHVRRAQRRRAPGAAEDTDMPGDIEAAEERYEGEEEDGDNDDDDDDEQEEGGGGEGRAGRPRAGGGAAGGRKMGGAQKAAGAKKGGGPTDVEVAPLPGDDPVPMTAFNLNEERQEGHFDEEGNFVFDKGDPGDKEDAWLQSEEGKAVMNAELRKRVEAEHEAMMAAEAAPVLGEAQVARAQLEMSRLMLPGENVAAALKRMKGGDGGPKRAMGKREKARLAKLDAEGAAKAAAKGAASAVGGPGAADDAGFQRLTELADTLVSSGELDVYSATSEQLKRWAALVLPQAEVEGGGAAGGAGGKRAAPDDRGDDDMFASDDEGKAPKPPPTQPPAAAAAPPGAGPSAPEVAAAAASAASAAAAAAAAAGGGGVGDGGVDYASWPIKELRRFLQERGQDTSGIVEKQDLVARVKEEAAKGPARARG